MDGEIPETVVRNVKIENGVIEAGPVEFQIPIDILAEFFIVQVARGRLRFKTA